MIEITLRSAEEPTASMISFELVQIGQGEFFFGSNNRVFFAEDIHCDYEMGRTNAGQAFLVDAIDGSTV